MKKILISIALFLQLAQSALAAFPTNAVLDNFNRTDQGPPPSSNWSGIYTNPDSLKVASNVCVGSNAGDDNDGRWNVQTYGPGSEVYATVSNKGAASDILRLYARANSSTSGYPGGNNYVLYYSNLAGTDTLRLRRQDDAVGTTLATFNQEVSSGDGVGMTVIGTTLTAYYKAAAGSWASAGTITDSTYSSAGYLGMDINTGSGGLTMTVDDFGGGTLTSSKYPFPDLIWHKKYDL